MAGGEEAFATTVATGVVDDAYRIAPARRMEAFVCENGRLEHDRGMVNRFLEGSPLAAVV